MLGAVSIAVLGAILGPIFLKRNMAKPGMVFGWVGGLIIGTIAFNVYFAWESDPALTFAIIGMHILGALGGAITGALVAGESMDRFSARVIGGFEGAVIGVIIGAHVVETEAFYGTTIGAILAGIFGILGALEPRP